MIGMRAEPYAYGSDENVDLELFLMSRARHEGRDAGRAAVAHFPIRRNRKTLSSHSVSR
jgi:hypothetical protein